MNDVQYSATMLATVEKEYNVSLELNPEDFKDCSTLFHLESKIKQLLDKKIPVSGDFYVAKRNIKMSDDFLKEWKQLVGFIEGNIMTYEHKDRCIKNADYYRVISGKHLNESYKNRMLFDLGLYKNFAFRSDRNYRLYIHDVDYDYSFVESVLFAEETNEDETYYNIKI